MNSKLIALAAVLVSTTVFAQAADAPTADPLPISVQRRLEVKQRRADLASRASTARGLRIGGFGVFGAALAAMTMETAFLTENPFSLLARRDRDAWYFPALAITAAIATVGLVVGIVGTNLGSGVEEDRAALLLDLMSGTPSTSAAPSARLLPDPLALY